MIIGPFSLSEWTAQRYELSYEGSRLGNYTAWDIIRLFDEGQITEDSMMAAVGYPTVGRFAEGYLFKHKDELRALNGALGQVIMIDLLTKIRWSLVAIALIAALTLINGLFYFIRIW